MWKAHSSRQDLPGSMNEIRSALGSEDPSLVVCFTSSRHDPSAVAHALHESFPGASTIGCTTAGEFVSGHMLKDSIVAMAFGRDDVARAATAIVDDVHDPASVPRALAELERLIGAPLRELDPSRFVGLVLCDGMSGGEEKVMEALSDRVNIPFVGGSAGDDAKFVRTYVFAQGRSHANAAALALLELPRGYAILKTQSFDDSGKKLRVTKADASTRTVDELDGKPAAEAYAAAVGVPVAELASQFMEHPLGLMVDGQPFVRSPQQIKGTSVVFYCDIAEGMELHVLDSRNIVEDTRAYLRDHLDDARGMLLFNCILRTLELEAKDQCDAYGKLFTNIPTVGFSTYGEQYVGHINQTATMLALR